MPSTSAHQTESRVRQITTFPSMTRGLISIRSVSVIAPLGARVIGAPGRIRTFDPGLEDLPSGCKVPPSTEKRALVERGFVDALGRLWRPGIRGDGRW